MSNTKFFYHQMTRRKEKYITVTFLVSLCQIWEHIENGIGGIFWIEPEQECCFLF